MRETILGYFIFGVMWGAWLEYYTTKHNLPEAAGGWTNRERVFNILCWPVSFSIFLITFFKGLF